MHLFSLPLAQPSNSVMSTTSSAGPLSPCLTIGGDRRIGNNNFTNSLASSHSGLNSTGTLQKGTTRDMGLAAGAREDITISAPRG
jgi:hypothetical protein